MPQTCAPLPAPTIAAVAWSGFDFSQAISSLPSFTGNPVRPAKMSVVVLKIATGSRSVRTFHVTG